MSNTKRRPQPNKTSRGGESRTLSKFKKNFRDETPHYIVYNVLPTVPRQIRTKVRTFSVIPPAAATASISTRIFTNSLLHTSDDMSSPGTFPGLNEFASPYSKYRVISYKVWYVLSPRHTVDANMAVIHSSVDPSYSAGAGFSNNSVAGDKTEYHLVPANTKSPCIVKGKSGYGMASLVGHEEYEQEAAYSGTITAAGVFTDPTELTYLTFYQGLATGIPYAAGQAVQISVILEQFVELYDKRY